MAKAIIADSAVHPDPNLPMTRLSCPGRCASPKSA